jgi:hypothetical protein
MTKDTTYYEVKCKEQKREVVFHPCGMWAGTTEHTCEEEKGKTNNWADYVQ